MVGLKIVIKLAVSKWQNLLVVWKVIDVEAYSDI